MQDPQLIEKLINRYLDGTASKEEAAVFLHLLEKGELDPYFETEGIQPPMQMKKRSVVRRLLPYAVAAALIGAIAIGFLFYKNDKAIATDASAVAAVLPTAEPGMAKAILTLSDGKQVALGTSRQALQDGASAIKQEESQLVYGVAATDIKETRFNTVSTPRGGEYRVVLPDGTRVWMNASSSLHYPVAFNGSERRVTLSGEDYFEVSKDPKKPFIVAAAGTETKVLGTHFNIQAYADDASLTATLAEGSIQLSKGGSRSLLRPGEKATVAPSGALHVSETNVEADLAWKDGYFQFDKTDLATIMKQLSRWYDLDIRFANGQVPEKRFVGKISRYTNLSAVLKILQLSNIKFSKTNNVLVIEE